MRRSTAPSRRDATLKDVAKLAGVSTATVARVLHDNGYVAPETRRIVEAALAESGYRVNAVAQGLRRQRTLLLGHVLQSIVPNPFFATVALAAQQEASRHGWGMLMFNTEADSDVERQVVEMLLRQRVDAILFTTVTSEENVRLAVNAGIPVVQVERAGTLDTDSVTVDNYPGACEGMAHLIELGHRRIAFIGLDLDTPIAADPGSDTHGLYERRSVERERLAGYLDSLAEHGIPLDEQLLDLGSAYSSPEHGQEVTRRLLALPPEQRPTAIFAGCDLLAVGVMQVLLEAGLRVPDDLSVIGFDDTLATKLAPPLTSIAQPMVELGQRAVRLAIDAIGANGERPARHERLTTRLVVRASTAPAIPAAMGRQG